MVQNDRAVSEVVGTILLIAIMSLAVSILAVGMISQFETGTPLPATCINISSDGSSVYIEHQGGDPIPDDELRIRIDGSEVDFSGQTGGNDWSIGEILEHPGTPKLVQIIYAGSSRSDLLYSFSQEISSPSPSTTHGDTIHLIAYDKPARLIGGTYIKFTYTGWANEWDSGGKLIFTDGKIIRLNTGDQAKLELIGDVTTDRLDMTGSTISNFPYPVKFYRNGNPSPEKIGTIQTIWIAQFSDIESTLTFKTPAGTGHDELKVDGIVKIKSDPPTSNEINIYNIVPAQSGATFVILEGRPEIQCGGEYEIFP